MRLAYFLHVQKEFFQSTDADNEGSENDVGKQLDFFIRIATATLPIGYGLC